MELPEFELLLQKILHGTASADEELLVQQWLNESEEHRKIYCQHARLEALLHMRGQGIKALLSPTPVISLNVLQQGQKKKMIKWMALSTIAALLIIGISLTFFISAPPTDLAFKTAPNTEYTVTHKQKGSEGQMRLEKGSTLTLKSGSVELEFDSGVVSIVEAPARLTLLNNDHVRLDHGKAWFDVPSDAVGFTVTTPEIEVVDLGTEFAITSTKQQEDECHVFKGEVEVTALNGLNESTTLNAGDAVKNTFAGRLTPIKLNELTYLKSLPIKPLYLHWLFDSIEDGNFTTESSYKSLSSTQNTLHSKQAIENAQVAGKYGKALQFTAKNDYLSSDWKGISGSQPRTVAFWVKQSSSSDAFISSLLGWGKRGSNRVRQTSFLFFTQDLNDGTKAIGLTTNSFEAKLNKRIAFDHWVHFACVYHGDLDANGYPNVSFYLNGELEDHTNYDYLEGDSDLNIDTLIDDGLSHPMIIGSSLKHAPDGIAKEAALDELYIIEDALDAKSVKHLFQNNELKE